MFPYLHVEQRVRDGVQLAIAPIEVPKTSFILSRERGERQGRVARAA